MEKEIKCGAARISQLINMLEEQRKREAYMQKLLRFPIVANETPKNQIKTIDAKCDH